MTPTRTDYDSEFCGKIPLHRINVIQPYGALLVLRKTDLVIIQCSQNTEAILGIPYNNLCGQPLTRFLETESEARLAELLQLAAGHHSLPERMGFTNGRELRVLLQEHPDYYLLEAVEAGAGSEKATFAFLYQQLKKSMAYVSQATTLQQACQAALEELQKLTGFDRLMIYRFDPEWNGTVIAEVHQQDMTPYLDLRFPASDVPKGARELYRTCRYRHIPDRQYEPVKLYPYVNPETNTFTDLSACNLRGVAAVHLEYLGNMGVEASMSTRILLDGELWGLISCHHCTPKYLTYEEAAIFELLSDVISTKILALEKATHTDQMAGLQKTLTDLMERILFEQQVPRGLLQEPENLLKLLGADGVALSSNRTIYTAGAVPDEVAIEELIFWLQLNHTDGVVPLHKLAGQYEPACDLQDVASGAIIIPIRPEQGDYIIGFRPELIQEISWGGNPEEAIRMEADNLTYHPRASFRVWQQKVRGASREWTPAEVLMAGRLRNFIQEFLLREYSRRHAFL